MHLRPHLLLTATLLTAIAVPALAQGTAGTAPVTRMAADAHTSFAVASIKPHDPNSNHGGFDAHGDRFTVQGRTVASLMMFAYAIHPRQIVDAPDWVFHDSWDVEGTTDTPGEPNLRQMQEMLQKLLADRFGLKFHRDKRELSVFALQIAKGGPKLRPAANPTAEADQDAEAHGSEVTQIYTSAAMSDFAMGMQFFVPDRPIVDHTGLTGRYDIRLRYIHDEANSTDPNAPPGLFTAIQEQLGLKLQPVKAPVDVFVIDTVQKPSEN
jgi:uncharacterized protein (TIGR03435 family)